jgi:hypothetical protein
MLSSILLVGAYCGLSAAAGPFPWMYGVPDYPDLGLDEIMTDADVDTILAPVEDVIPTSATQSDKVLVSAVADGREPCAVISSAIAAMPSGSRPIVPAELGVRCLQSVPLDKEGDVRLIDDLKLFVKWQSNIAYLKKPPADYTEEPVDVMGELDRLASQLSTDTFKSEYDFQMSLMTVFDRAYDNHFVWQPDVLASAMQFQRPPGTELIALSTDGMSVPDIFTYRDVLRANNDSSFQPSAVTMIDGVTARDYLANASTFGDFHDADTRWNAMFPSQALIAAGTTFLGAFRTGMYTGQANTTLQFANGTTFSMPNIAVVFGNFSNVDSGRAFFDKFCNGPRQAAEAAQDAASPTPSNQTAAAAPVASHIGYPKAEFINPSLAVGGYYITGNGYEVRLSS